MENSIITLVVLSLVVLVCLYVSKCEKFDKNLKLIQCFLVWSLPLLVATCIYSIVWLFSGSLEEDELVSSHDTGDFGIGSRLRYNH